MPESIDRSERVDVESFGDESESQSDKGEDKKKEESKKNKEKNSDAREKAISDSKKKISERSALVSAIAIREALFAKKSGESMVLGEKQMGILIGVLSEAGVSAETINKLAPKDLYLVAFSIIRSGRHEKLKEEEQIRLVEEVAKVPQGEVENISVYPALAGGAEGDGLGEDDIEALEEAIEHAQGEGREEEVANLRKQVEVLSSQLGQFRSRGEKPLEEVRPKFVETRTVLKKLIESEEGSEECKEAKDELKGLVGEVRESESKNKNYQLVADVTEAIQEYQLRLSAEPQKDNETNKSENMIKFEKTFREFGEGLNLSNFIKHKEPEETPEETPKKTLKKKLKETYIGKLDKYFRKIWVNMEDDQRRVIAGDIDGVEAVSVSAVLSGWRDLEYSKKELINMASERGDSRGVREWRGSYDARELEKTVREQEKTRVSIPEDIPEKLHYIFKKAEAQGLSSDEIGPILQDGMTLIRTLPEDTPAARKKREELLDRLESFRAIHIFLISLEKSDMDPGAVIKTISELFEGRNDVTMENFIARFNEDERGRFLYATDGEKKPERVNLFDLHFQLYSESLRRERIKMNVVEEMTKYHWGHFNVEKMRKDSGYYNLDAQLQQHWNEQFGELKVYFSETLGGDLGKWGDRKHVEDIAKHIKNWHQKKTLHGAFGTIQEEGISDLAKEFGIDMGTDVGKIEANEMFFGKQYLDVRREVMQEELKDELKKRGLSYDPNIFREKHEDAPTGDLCKSDLVDMEEKGYFESLDNNAYKFAWFLMWGNYNNIRVYSDKKSRWHDDYDAIVYHGSTNLFNERAVDHIWEFFHATNENRGRAKEDETNVIWKQSLPGKHHYVFPQNTMMVRWAELFMNDEQKAVVIKRVREYDAKYDFDSSVYNDEFVGWMKSVVIMDMIENGEFSMGGTLMSKVAHNKDLTKFAFIDVYSDRSKHKKYTDPENFQSYLANPTNKKFFTINSKEEGFYSTRSARQFSWMTFAMRAHWQIGNKHYKKLFDKEDMQSVEMENVVNELAANGFIEKPQAVDFKRKNLGFVKVSPHGDPDHLENSPVVAASADTSAFLFGSTWARRLRQSLEMGRKSAWDEKFGFFPVILAFMGGFITGLFGGAIKQIPGQTMGGGR